MVERLLAAADALYLRAENGIAALPRDCRPAIQAARLVYAKGLDLQDPEAAVPIGMGCKVCEREHCTQRAFPYVGRALQVDENQSRFTPYGSPAAAPA